MMSINYAEGYSKELANAYGYVLYFGKLWDTENSRKYKTVDAKTIKIPNISTGGRVDGDRSSIGDFSQNWDNDWEDKTLTNHRMWQTLVHPQDIDQTNTAASIVNITKTMNETQKFPEMDAYLISRLYTLKNEISEIDVQSPAVLNKETILGEFDKMMDAMDEALVPPSGRILYVDTYTKTMLDNARETFRVNGDSSIVRSVSRIDEVEVISVPTKLMKTSYDFTNGWKPDEDADQVRMLLVHPSCVLPVASYSFAQLSEPSAMSQGKYVYYEESFEDVFILDKRHEGIQMLVCSDDE
ncbi:MAG: capsid protein [Oscillospiraceae bacterium]|nr:capsid protein [Oscillospiraceae bacterium]